VSAAGQDTWNGVEFICLGTEAAAFATKSLTKTKSCPMLIRFFTVCEPDLDFLHINITRSNRKQINGSSLPCFQS
jgi:hypothetical protein